MAKFEPAVALTLQHEGGYVDNPNDPGGATNFGITQADMPGVNMQTITQAEAIDYYVEHYWKPLYYDIESQDVANKLFDLGVLFGVGQAVKGIQDVVNVTADGDFGPHTLLEVNETDPASLLTGFKFHLVQLAIAIATEHPAERVFLSGWVRRINA